MEEYGKENCSPHDNQEAEQEKEPKNNKQCGLDTPFKGMYPGNPLLQTASNSK